MFDTAIYTAPLVRLGQSLNDLKNQMSSRETCPLASTQSLDSGYTRLWPAEEIDQLLRSALSPSRKVSCPAQTVPPNSPSVRTHQLSSSQHTHTHTQTLTRALLIPARRCCCLGIGHGSGRGPHPRRARRPRDARSQCQATARARRCARVSFRRCPWQNLLSLTGLNGMGRTRSQARASKRSKRRSRPS